MFSYLPCLQAPLTSTVLYHFHWPSPCLGSQGQRKTWFSRTFFNWSGWNLMWCWSSPVGTPVCYFEVTFNDTRETTAVLLIASKKLDVCLHSDIYESIWFKHVMMIDAVELYIVIWVYLTLRFIHLRASHLTKFSIDLNGIRYTVEILLVWWISYSIYLIRSIFKGESHTYVLSLKIAKQIECWLVFRHLQNDFFQTWYDDRNH